MENYQYYYHKGLVTMKSSLLGVKLKGLGIFDSYANECPESTCWWTILLKLLEVLGIIVAN